MLNKISCAHFREHELSFERGLNVVWGDESGSNSIGKSTALMLIDFAFGGSDFSVLVDDIVHALDHHEYEFTFTFSGQKFRFRRGTRNLDQVYRYVQGEDHLESISIDEYRAWLKESYALIGEHLSFRECVSPHLRIWRRETFQFAKPFNSHPRQAEHTVVASLLKVLGKYDAISGLETELKQLKDIQSARSRAEERGMLPEDRDSGVP